MTRILALLLPALFAFGLVMGCPAASDPSPACEQWIDCVEGEFPDGDRVSYDIYRPANGVDPNRGVCWSGDADLAADCTQECEDLLAGARADLDDAGTPRGACGGTAPVDGGS